MVIEKEEESILRCNSTSQKRICIESDGHPRDRDLKLVRWDVLNGKINLESAKENYKLVFNPDLTVNEKQMKVLRGKGEGSV
jgi:hypothetical protein